MLLVRLPGRYTCLVCYVKYIVRVIHNARAKDSPALLYPSNHIPTESECVRGVKQSSLGTLEHLALLYQIVQYRLALRDIRVERIVRVLNEGMFTQGMLFSRRVQWVWRATSEWGFCWDGWLVLWKPLPCSGRS